MTDSNAASGIPTSVGDSLIGKEIDGCAIVKKIGQGGMGIVYLAEHTKLRQQYVVKILNPALVAAEDTVQRFFREAQSVARLNHPSIVSIQNVGQEGDYYYIRMEYVDGDTVENIIKQEKKLDWKLATKIVLDTADALSHAHKKGIIHRDIKPENIMFTTGGQVKVMDFGLAKQVQAATKVSVTGQIVGTPFFMSPEQAGGKTTDARSDIYSLGVTYYYLLTGVKPFNGKNLQEIFLKHFFYTPESPKIFAPDLPENVCEIIRRCLKKKKKERYQSAAELAHDLRIAIGEEGGTISTADAPVFQDDEDATAPKLNGIATSGSDPSIPADSGDLAAARAEINADDESKTVNVSSRARPGLTDEPPPSSGDGDEPAAPIQKRGGRAAIEAVASASIVFNRGGPFPTSLPGTTPEGEEAAPVQRRDRVALDQVAGASVVFQPKKPATEQATEATGTATLAPANGSTLNLQPGARKADGGTRRQPAVEKRSSMKAVGLALAGLALLGGIGYGSYEMVGRSKCGVLERRYSALTKDPPGDSSGWRERSKQYSDLAVEFDDLTQGPFSYSSAAVFAAQFGNKCRVNAIAAKDAADLGDVQKIPPEKLKEMLAAREALQKAIHDAVARIAKLESDGKFADASEAAVNAYETLIKPSNLPPVFRALIKIPLQVTVNPPGSKLVAPDGTVLGETPANGSPLVIHALPGELKFSAKHAKFKTSPVWSEFVTGFKKVSIDLERDAKQPIDLGTFGPLRRGRQANVFERVQCEAPFSVDSTAGALIFTIRQGEIRSIDNKLGRPNWKTPVAAGDYGDPSGGPEVLPGRAVFAAGCDGVVRAIDANTGQVVWTQPLNAPVGARPRLTSDGFGLIVGTLNGDIIMLDSQGQNGAGKIVWTVNADAAIDTRPATRGDVVYAGSRDGKLQSLDKKNGNQLSLYDAQDGICAGPIVVGDRIYIGTRLGRVHVLSVQDPNRAIFVTEPMGSPIVDLGVTSDAIYAATAQELRAIKLDNTGAFFPAYQPGAQIVGLALMKGHVGVVTTTGEINALDLAGNPSWTFALKNPKGEFLTVGAPPVVVGDDLYVITREGWLIIVAAD